jgi:hypothetical protein
MPSLAPPTTDPTPIFEHYRGSYGSELLTAAVAHLGVFRHLAAGPMSLAELRAAFGIEERAAVVLMVALRAMKLVAGDWPNRLELTPAAREHLVPGGAFYVGDYLGLSADAPACWRWSAGSAPTRPPRTRPPPARTPPCSRSGTASSRRWTTRPPPAS